MKRYIETFFALVPYLEQYPLWVNALISIWLLLTAAVFLALLFGRPHQPLPEETASPKAVTASHAVGAEPQSPQRIFINRTVDEVVEPFKDMTSYQVAELVKR